MPNEEIIATDYRGANEWYIGTDDVLEQESTRFYVHQDEYMTTMAITNAYAESVFKYIYNPYGEAFMVYNNGEVKLKPQYSYLFQGRNFDAETGNYYFRTRYYNPEHGSFLSIDTIGTWADENNLGNPYAFLGNNPWSGTDPFGECRAWQLRCKAKQTRAFLYLQIANAAIEFAVGQIYALFPLIDEEDARECLNGILVGTAIGIVALRVPPNPWVKAALLVINIGGIIYGAYDLLKNDDYSIFCGAIAAGIIQASASLAPLVAKQLRNQGTIKYNA